MGFGSFCFCLPYSSSKRQSNLNENNSGFLTAPKAQIMDRSKNSIEMKEKEMQLPLQETKQQLQEEEKREFTTFKEWLLASPPTNGFYTSNGDEIIQQRNFMKQNKVHPSLVADFPDYGYNNPKGSFSKKRTLMGGEVDGFSDKDERMSSFRKSRSKKIKKRVSFRMPEEADVFIYNLTEEDA